MTTLAWKACLIIVSGFMLSVTQARDFSSVIQRRSVSSVPQCRNPNGHLGICKSIYDCDTVLNAVLQQQQAEFVRASLCAGSANRYQRKNGLRGKPPYVCCTDETDFVAPTGDERNARNIIFPDDERLKPMTATTTNTTIATTNSSSNATIIATIMTTTTTRYTTLANTDNANATVTTTTPTPITTISSSMRAVLPRPPHCGVVTLSNKIYGGVETEPNEFPWMANLEYRRPNGALTSVCAGSLINERYVLTAAHCVKGQIERVVGQIVGVRLGIHNTALDANCNDVGCNPTTQRHKLESITVHEHYDQDKDQGIHQHHDIALLRLAHAVLYTPAVQAVCIPQLSQMAELSNGQKLTVAGWGHNGTVKHTDTKHKVIVPYVELEQCRRIYAQKMYIAEEQLCAGGVYLQDSCTGDSGGPLMRINTTAWVLEGIVSYGRSCGLENKPGIYTRVRSYLRWIAYHVKP